MLIFSSIDTKPMIYTGLAWETLCTENINSLTTQEYFVVKNGIPFLPTFASVPAGSLTSGTVYYSTVNRSVMIYSGAGWLKMVDMLIGNIAESSGFSAGADVKTFKLPVLNANPSTPGLTVGAFYINSVSKVMRYYNGALWQDISCQAVVKTLPLTLITGYTAMSGAEVITNAGSPVTLTGICWSPNSNPDTLLTSKTRITTTGSGIGIFTSPLTDLLPKTIYHVRAYAVNSLGIVYGEDLTFTTPIQLPTIITLDASNITSISVQTGGNITADGGASVTKRGTIWSSISDPLDDPSHFITNDGSGVGYYPTILEGLLGNTNYNVRAFAVNSVGTSYGNLIQFTTLLPVPPVLNPTLTVSGITGSSTTGTALILNNGGALVTERGVCYSIDGLNYIYIPSSTVTPTDIGTFMTTVTGLSQGTTYYLKGYAKNIAGTGYTSETSVTTALYASITTVKPGNIAGSTASSGGVISNTGFSEITARGVCWSLDKNPTTALVTKTSNLVVGDGTGTFASQVTGLLAGTTYYIKAYAVNSAGVGYGNLDSIVMPDSARVLTLAASSLYLSTATCGGDVISDGGSVVMDRGVCWSTGVNPTIFNSRTTDGDGLGIYTSYLTGLIPNISYHFRAFAINSIGVSYGEDLSLTVIPDAPLIITLPITEITNMSGVSGGDIKSSGGAPITLRGILWSTKGDPLTDDQAIIITNDGSGVGIFPTKMDNLLGSTTYYVRAYAVNSYGKAYGDLKVFTTLPPLLSVVLSPSFDIEQVNNTSAVGVFLVLNNGGSPITDRGIRYSTDRLNYTYVTSETLNKTDIGTYITTLHGLKPNTTYFAQAYAINAVGTALSSEASFRTTSLALLSTTPPNRITGFAAYSGGEITSTGDDIISAKGVCWSQDSIPTINLTTKTSETLSGIGEGVFISRITGLSPGVKYYVRAYAVNSFGIAYGNLDSLITATTAFVTTTHPITIKTTSAVSGGFINNDGNEAVYTRGICYSSHSNPTTADNYIASGSGIGSYAITINGLMGSTKYYVRAYAINDVGIAYGNLDSLKTSAPVLEALSTTDVINIGGTTAVGRGYVGSVGGAPVTERGFCWNTTGNPDINGQYVASGVGNGSFSGGLTDLTPNTTYYVRAYAINSVGTSYGNEITFSTFTIATLITTPATSITNISAKSGGDIVSDGGALVYSSGICWNTTGNPTINDASTNSGLGIGNFIHYLNGLLGSTKYYIRAYAINYAGIAYGNVEVFTTAPPVIPTLTTNGGSSGANGKTGYCGGVISSNGGSLINTEGIVWSLTSGFLPDTVLVNKTMQAGSGNFNSTLGNLKSGTTYYARAYASNTVGTGYAANEVSFTTFDLPVITTIAPTAVTNVTVNSGGIITSNGGTGVTESGLCWSTGNLPGVADEHFSNGPGFGLFNRTITELLGSTIYYLRSYAINSVGITYGQVESFTTQPPKLATIYTLQPVATSSIAAISGGNITSHGGSLVTSRGIYWSTQQTFDPDTITLNKTAQTGYYKGTFNASLTGLIPNTVYYVKAYVENGVGISYGDEMSFKTPTQATLTTKEAFSDGPTRAVTGGVISDNGGAEISSRGVIWSTVASFDPATETSNRTYDDYGTGSFVSRPSGLKGNTTYYIMAYATNIAGTGYGNLVSFITDPATPPNLTTRDAWYVYGTSAVTGGYVSDNGGEPIITRGVVWGTDPLFRPDTVLVNKTVDGAMGVGYFSTTMTGLKRGTIYYVKAYAKNSIGTAYGNVISFKTLDFAKLTTMPVSPSSTGYEAGGGGVLIDDGGNEVTNQGVCWSLNPNPTVGLYTKTMYDGWSGNSFYSTLTNLAPVTKYYVRAYATNNQGAAYGNEVSFTTPVALPVITTSYATQTSKSSVVTGGNITFNGGAPVTERGVIWSTNIAFNPDTVVVNKTTDGIGNGKYNSVISNMNLSITYYIRAYAVNSAGISYGNQITITLFPTAPVLNTIELTQITGSTVMSGGEITSDGGALVTLKGLCWNTSTNPITTNSHTTNGSGTDPFAAMISGLLPNTLYYVRAYAINSIGTAYGIERTFQTNGIPTLTATTPASNIIATTATSGGEITDNGRTPIITRGICWSTYSNPSLITPNTYKTIDNSSSTIGSFIANMKGLTSNSTYYVRAYATNAVGTGYGSQIQFKTFPIMLPTIYTLPPTSIDSVKATSGGNIFDNGGVPITGRGICWSTIRNFDITISTKVYNAVSDTGVYNNNMTGLSPGIKYYVKAFAINSKGTAYGMLDSLVTKPIRATVSNVVISNITQNDAIGSASVITTGGATVTSRGVCWNTTGYPSLADDTLCIGSGLGIYADTLKNLVEGPIYYVRAFATNSAGTSYSSTVSSFRICPSAFKIVHYEGLNGAPVTKTVTYGSVSSNASGAARCWITQNLGADHQATTVTDATESSSGWYWQFNRPQGYQYTASRYPATTWTSNTEASDWVKGNDPCNLLLGSGWRIPTSTEYLNVIATGTIPFSSPLKLHYSGYLNYADGSTAGRGTYGIFWSSSATATTNATYLQFSSGANANYNSYKWHGFTLRCLRDSTIVGKPTVSNVVISTMTKTTAVATAAVTPDGGAPVLTKGLCWNTTGNPTSTENTILNGIGTGVLTDTISGLTEGPTYYIRAFATNSTGITYCPVVTVFKVCPSDFTVQHVEGLNGAPVSKTVLYHSVSSIYSGAARCWITQNLGADHQASSVADATEPSAGWYWQFNRLKAYQFTASRLPSTTWTSNTEASDWVPEKDPCNMMLGGGWRIPTATEYASVIANGGIPFATPLKLHYSGYLNNADGSILGRNTYGIFWSSSATTNTVATYLQFSAGVNTMYTNTVSSKWYGFTLRCLRDTIVLSKPSVSNVTFSGMTSTSADVSAIVTPDGGSPVTERGFCWNTTGNPDITNNPIANGSGTGNFTGTISGGLVEGPTYYVRAYAKNNLGIAYSTDVNSFRICPPVFTVQHMEGIGGAPVTKKVAYHSVSSTLSGKAVCWLIQNLGADSIASANTDATEQAGGWYWQFNRVQGFKNDGIVRTPATSWIATNETSNWIAINDPCTQLLGSGWRIPTNTEWVNVIANGNLANTMAYNSPLKLHIAGNLDNGSFINKRGISTGLYWSSTQSAATTGYSMYFSTAGSVTYNLHSKSQYAFSVRCLRDTIVVLPPSVGTVSISISSMTGTTADATSAVGSDGGSQVTERGFCWNVTGNPTLSDNYVTNSTGGTGNFTSTITGLSEGPKFYVRAYARNSAGITYSEGSGFSAILTNICPDTFNVQHNIGFRGVPVTKKVTYHTVGSYMSGSAKCWITQNLGADHPATSAFDATEASAGWYFQFNHSLGYKNAGSTTPIAWYGGFNEVSDWTLINDPCNIMLGTDWRLPTSTEWTNVDGAPQNWATYADPYNSALKLHNPGYLAYNTSVIASRGSQGNYWSSTGASATTGYDFQFYNAGSGLVNNDKAYGFSVRCLRAGVVKMPPTLTNVVISTTSMTDSTAEGSAKIVVDGGSAVLTRGICWNTTGYPTVNDNVIPGNLSDSTFNGLIVGLKEGPTYYIRAYATNKIGLGYSPLTTTFKICPPAFDILHSAVFNGSPITKTVTYHSVNSMLSGAARCWTTQNLGADRPANAAKDTTAAAAGWYWQFNRLQGFQAYGAALTPSVGWQTAIGESADWTVTTDPCVLMLSAGWRIPTSTEWSSAVTNGGWAGKSAYTSELILHYGGQIKTAVLADRGTFGHFWSGTQTAAANASYLEYNAATSASQVLISAKSGMGKSVRCLRDNFVISIPIVSKVTMIQMTDSVAIGTATVTPDGGAPVTSRGLCWNSTGNPTTADHVIPSGTNGIGDFTSSIPGLEDGRTYFVRAFATNSAGTAYSPTALSFKICKPYTAIHIGGQNGAPESKTVKYSSISTSMSGALRCWITQNLGADTTAVSASDNAERAAGWFWQFNRSQGYKPNGASYIPYYAWVGWLQSANENSDWAATTDPCRLLLAAGWRMPTTTEWTNADGAPQNWAKSADTYSSVLKLHAAGYMFGGVIAARGTTGDYWSINQGYYYSGGDRFTGNCLSFNTTTSAISAVNKWEGYAFNIRCIRDTVILEKPTLTNVRIPTSDMTVGSATTYATVTLAGGAAVTDRGFCWSSTSTVPTKADSVMALGNGVGNFDGIMKRLIEGTTYYVRAYAVNSVGIAYSPTVTAFKICNPVKIIHRAGQNGAPEDKTVTYHTISTNISGTARCWITQNLGSDREAGTATDTTQASAGWYWQFNRLQGYKPNGTSYIPINAWTAWVQSANESSDWAPANDPCRLELGAGWRMPSQAEWSTSDAAPQFWGNYNDAYNSVLKLHTAGYMLSGTLKNRGTTGGYWSSTQGYYYSGGDRYTGYYLSMTSSTSDAAAFAYKPDGYGFNVRCLRDVVVIEKPSVTNVNLPTSEMTTNSATGYATVSLDGGAAVIDRGLCWSTSSTVSPTTNDNVVKVGNGTGDFNGILNSLSEGPTYYIRAYATNSAGTGYSPIVTSFKMCNPFTIIHQKGLNGAPENKTVIYHAISTGLSGAARCWITQNLGADSTAVSVADNTESAAGWYWQFNRSQGYKPNGGSYIPYYAWVGWVQSANESSDWAVASDPCRLQLGAGWRMPTSTEWTAVDAIPQNWGKSADAYNSVLKLHAAGYMYAGALASRSVTGDYWSSTQGYYYSGGDRFTGGYLTFNATTSGMANVNKWEGYAYNVRCLRDVIILEKPSVTNVTFPTSDMTVDAAKGYANVTLDGGTVVTDRGLVWSITSTVPTVMDTKMSLGSGTGDFTGTLNGLTESPTYYVRAYAVNSVGITYSPLVTSFKICNPFIIIHKAGQNGAPADKTVTYHSISTNISGAARCWITQNLGAEQEATLVTDTTQASAGWYWQFNRLQGYKPNGTSYIPINAWTAWVQSANESSDWAPANDPCRLELGAGWRMPSQVEWSAADAAPQYWGTYNDAYNSVLKLHTAGYILGGTLKNRGTTGSYWSSTQGYYYSGGDRYTGYYLSLTSATSDAAAFVNKWDGYGFNVRCLRDVITIEKPSVTNVNIPTSDMTANTAKGYATVTLDGGATVTERGLCWSTNGAALPTTTDNILRVGNGTGDFSTILSSLSESPTYYVRAYAINSAGTSYSPTVTSFKVCNPFTIIHRAGLNGAPEDKIVTYHTISTGVSGAARCWITQNLGADSTAVSVSDNSESAAGWYWQFNRSQGYKPNGGSYIPYYAWVGWVQSTNESSDWAVASDPCRLQLGAGWRMPTITEWTAVDAVPQNWGNSADAYNSVLKLHAAGYMYAGALASRGTTGDYWSTTQSSYYSGGDRYTGGYLTFNTIGSATAYAYKPDGYGFNIRCLRDFITLEKPSITNVTFPTLEMTINSAKGHANVTLDGGVSITDRGLCWSTSSTVPTISDKRLSLGTGTGDFNGILDSLIEGPTYYVRAYAINSVGITYSQLVTNFKICNSFTIIHRAGQNGAPADKTVTYHTISTNISGAARCWITQNLGAEQEATLVTDTTQASAGWYWQFNRLQGYKPNGTSYIPINAWTAWVQSANESSDWAPANDPCRLELGAGWRMPSQVEWSAADAAPQYWGTYNDAYNSVLKLHTAGYILGGTLKNRGTTGSYWSSTQGYYYSGGDRYTGYYLSLTSATSDAAAFVNKWDGYGFNVRCLRDVITIEKPSVTNVNIPTSDMTANTAKGYATVTLDGGATVTERGLCWSTNGAALPTTTDNILRVGNGTGDFSTILSSLSESPTYYVRAYAINSAGTSYSPTVTSFKVCNPFTIIHRAGLNGAPEDKIVTYHTISTGVSGAARCWITQNLGADSTAVSVSDNSESAAGWYWQFNRSQGYKPNGGSYIPYYAWVGWVQSTNESSDWAVASDPCRLQLGAGWRMPTITEWTAVDAVPQNWGNSADAYNSVLKLHAAGYMYAGALASRGTTGDYWSTTQSSYYSGGDRYTGGYLTFNTIGSATAYAYKPDGYGFNIRCLRDFINLEKPTVTNVTLPTSDMTIKTAKGYATVSLDGRATVTDRGLCWSTSSIVPTISDKRLSLGTGTGDFNGILDSLLEGPTYYVRAYAVNSVGISYSPAVSSFKICNPFTVVHKAGQYGAPVDKIVTYNSITTVISGSAKCWLTQNLGAERLASSATDNSEEAAGWYWQFNRSQGYKHDGTVRTPSTGVYSVNESSDWAAANDPCRLLLGTAWRLPTNTDWTNADAQPQYWANYTNTFASVLRLHAAGNLLNTGLVGRGVSGSYWTSTQGYYYSGGDRYTGNYLSITASVSAMAAVNKWEGYSFNIRCIRD